jgi:hypothetical protein
MKDAITRTLRDVTVRAGGVDVVASTDAPDRMGDIVDQSWVLEPFARNPVVLWGHDYSTPPIGRAMAAVTDGRLVASIEWDTAQDLGALVARQFDEGFLSAVSVGFRPGTVTPRSGLAEDDPRYSKGWGVVFAQNELLEISAVPVPANGESLARREIGELVARGLPVPGVSRATLDALVALLPGELLRVLEEDDEVRTRIASVLAVSRGVDPGLVADDWWTDSPQVKRDQWW